MIPMRSKSEARTTLDRINRDVGVSSETFVGNAPNQTGYSTEMQRVVSLTRMYVNTIEPKYPRKNKAETVIKIVKRKSKIRRVQRNIPKRVWDFGVV